MRKYYLMELAELIDRCLYEDELRDILITIGEEPNGAKKDLIMKLMESKEDPAEVLKLMDEDILTTICLESDFPNAIGKDQMLECILEDVLGGVHDYMEISTGSDTALDDLGEREDKDIPKVDFDEILNKVGGWAPINTLLPRAVITEELGDFLRREGYPIKVKVGVDIKVGSNVSIELARGREPKDVNSLLERMLRDLDQYEYSVGVVYGVERETVVEQLEDSLEGTFDELDHVAIVLI